MIVEKVKCHWHWGLQLCCPDENTGMLGSLEQKIGRGGSLTLMSVCVVGDEDN